MKIEFISPEGGLNEHTFIYITKGEFIRAYEKDKNKAYEDFQGIVEMFTKPACFYEDISVEYFEKIYSYLQHTKFKGITLNYNNDFSNITLQIELIQK